MGRKFNPDKTKPFHWRSHAPKCPHCGRGTKRGVHLKCAKTPTFAYQTEQEQYDLDQREQSYISAILRDAQHDQPDTIIEIINDPSRYSRPLI